MEIHHIFIFSSSNGMEAEDLVDFGFIEGSSRIHPKQGTTNRKFYFDNFFLEILWVINENEIQSEVTSKTKLWERSQFEHNQYARYGLCLGHSDSTDSLFKNSEIYQPHYFPIGMSIDMITNEQFPDLPWTFRLPFRGENKPHTEPIHHPNGIKSLTHATFGVIADDRETDFERCFNKCDIITFKKSNRLHLTLEFDHHHQGKTKEFPELSLTINY